MDNITRKADELRDLIYNSIKEILNEERGEHYSKIRELEQRLAITQERERQTSAMITSYERNNEAQGRITDALDEKLNEIRRELDNKKELCAIYEDILDKAFGTKELKSCVAKMNETKGLVATQQRQVAELSSKVKIYRDLLMEAQKTIHGFVKNPTHIPLLDEISKATAI